MALNLKTAGCGVSLRVGTIILLYINLICNILSMLSAVCGSGDPVYNQFMDDNVDFFIDLVWLLIESLIFAAAIIAISKEKGIISMLITVVIFLLLEAFCWIYLILKLNFSESFENSLRNILEEESKEYTKINQEKYGEYTGRTVADLYPLHKTILNIVFIAALIYKIYSAMVIHSYEVELKQKLSDGLATKITAPPAYEGHFTPPQYPNTDLPPHKAGAV